MALKYFCVIDNISLLFILILCSSVWRAELRLRLHYVTTGMKLLEDRLNFHYNDFNLR